MLYIFVILVFILAFILLMDFRPVRKLNFLEKNLIPNLKTKPPVLNYYNVIIHIHTQFSFDSLGKPSDIKKAMEVNSIDFVFITDHDNTDFKYFETENISAGIEINTEEGRLLLLDNKLPVISHPNNFEFEHYRWKGEFKRDYLYELINVKDAIVWKKSLSILTVLKNLLLLPLTKNPYRKWNSLLPLEKWVELYYQRAKGLKIIGGLDHHVKFVYQEHTNGVLIPSYISGFKWVLNKVYSKKTLNGKEDILEELKKGNNFIFLNKYEALIWIEKDKNIYLNEDKIPKNSYINCDVLTKEIKSIKVLKRDNKPVLITDKNSFSYLLNEVGAYHLEIYEYDFKIGNIFFGFRPVGITNIFEVVNG